MALNKYMSVLILWHLAVLFTGCQSKAPHNDELTTVFRGVTIIDAVNGIRSDQNVIVSGNKIVEVGPANKIKEPSGANIIDCNRKFMIPGLWDAHIHLTNSAVITPVMYYLFLINGITYIRDTAGNLDLLLPLVEEAVRMAGMAPRVFITGPHMDGLPLSWNSSVGTTTVERAEQVMDSLIAAGVDHLKVYELISPDIYSAVLSMARNKGYKVSGHVPLTMDAIEAANAGLASIEHLNNLELAMSSDWDSLLQDRRQIIAEGTAKTGNELRGRIYRAQRMHAFNTQDESRRQEVIKALADNNTWQVPTLVCITATEQGMYAREDYRNTFRYLPEPARSEWEQRAIQTAGRSLSEVELAHANWANDLMPRLVNAGVGIMAGTDAPLFQLTPGFSLHEELALLVHAGLTPMQAIEAATLRPAQFFGLENQQGSISKGMLADLVILDANPLEDITNTQRIHAVMREGHLHNRDGLDRIMDQLEGAR
jgi:imidazolonepropionase-like amidohydrolase